MVVIHFMGLLKIHFNLIPNNQNNEKHALQGT